MPHILKDSSRWVWSGDLAQRRGREKLSVWAVRGHHGGNGGVCAEERLELLPLPSPQWAGDLGRCPGQPFATESRRNAGQLDSFHARRALERALSVPELLVLWEISVSGRVSRWPGSPATWSGLTWARPNQVQTHRSATSTRFCLCFTPISTNHRTITL